MNEPSTILYYIPFLVQVHFSLALIIAFLFLLPLILSKHSKRTVELLSIQSILHSFCAFLFLTHFFILGLYYFFPKFLSLAFVAFLDLILSFCYFILSLISSRVWRIQYLNVSSLSRQVIFRFGFFTAFFWRERGFGGKINKFLHRSHFSLFGLLIFGTAILSLPFCPKII